MMRHSLAVKSGGVESTVLWVMRGCQITEREFATFAVNDECRMTNDERMTKSECRKAGSHLQALNSASYSSFCGHWSFGLLSSLGVSSFVIPAKVPHDRARCALPQPPARCVHGHILSPSFSAPLRLRGSNPTSHSATTGFVSVPIDAMEASIRSPGRR